jgi:hypothetical protein
MRLWIGVAAALLILLTLALLLTVDMMGEGTAGQLTLINTVGLAAVIIGVIAAGAVLRRSSPTE